jgi:hypothetical protein
MASDEGGAKKAVKARNSYPIRLAGSIIAARPAVAESQNRLLTIR